MTLKSISAAKFRVRGPNYLQNGNSSAAKVPSQDALFHLAAVDVIKYDSKMELTHVASKLPLPESTSRFSGTRRRLGISPRGSHGRDLSPGPHVDSTDGWDCGVPDHFIVNLLLPSYKPKPFDSRVDGKGGSIAMYFYIKNRTRLLLRDLASAPPSIKLLQRFCQAAKNGDPDKGRLKIIPELMNVNIINNYFYRELIRNFNGTPFLTGPLYHDFHWGPNYLECDVDIHRFCFAAKKAASDFQTYLSKGLINLAVVVETREISSQPEQVLGCCHLEQLEPDEARSMNEVKRMLRQRRSPRKVSKTPVQSSRLSE
jgi:hypothetical protein